MHNYKWLLAGVAIILSACSDQQQALTQEQIMTARQDSAGMVSDKIVEASTRAVEQIVASDLQPVEAADSIPAQAIDSAGDAVATAGQDVSDTVVAAAGTAGAAGSMLVAKTPAAATPVVAVAAASRAVTADVDLVLGKKVYSTNCIACHGTGAAGAPKLGDAENWSPRIAQGMKVMNAHALNGFRGASGFMPAKGGFNSLPDEDVTAAVAYMASESH